METNGIMKSNEKLVFVLLGNGMDYGEAFLVASLNEILHDQLKQALVRFAFKKENGEVREAVGTLNPSYIERALRGKGVRKVKKATQVYYDVEKNEWRSFRVENLIGIF